MPLETGSTIGALNSSYPAASDGLAQADDHLRLLKAILLATFPNLNGVLAASHTELDAAVAATAAGATALAEAGVPFFTDTDTGIAHSAANKVGFVAGGTTRVEATSTGVELTGPISGGTGQLVPSGTVLDYAGATEPTGYLFCYGQAVSRTTYASLFTAISTIHGVGDGSTTFNLPDCRGRVVAGQDDMGGSSANRLTGLTNGVNGDTMGAAGGVEAQDLSIAQLPVVTPAGTVSAPIITTGNRNSALISGGGDFTYGMDQAEGTGTTTLISTASEPIFTGTPFGSGASHNNVQPTLILNKIIKI